MSSKINKVLKGFSIKLLIREINVGFSIDQCKLSAGQSEEVCESDKHEVGKRMGNTEFIFVLPISLIIYLHIYLLLCYFLLLLTNFCPPLYAKHLVYKTQYIRKK